MIYPAMASAGLAGGVYLGRNLLGGSAFTYDPWTAYNAGLTGNPNVLVLGSQSMGKSALVKIHAFRQLVFGRRLEVIDVKDEYGPLLEAVGGSSLAVYRNGPVRLNPLRPGPQGEPAQELAAAVAAAGLGRPLDPAERVGLAAAVEIVTKGAREEPTLPELVTLLLRPPGALQDALSSTGSEEPRRELRTLGLALQALCDGAMAGMFDGPTTASLNWDAPAIRLDLSQVADTTATAVLMTSWLAFLRQQHEVRAAECARNGTAPRQTIRVNDEAWRVAAVPGVAARFTAEFKLSRKFGVNSWIVLHKLADAAAGADDGTAAAKLMDALLADIDTHVVHRQDDGMVDETTRRLGMSETQSALLTELGPLQALWQIGRQQSLVTHEISTYESPIVDTDHAMRNEPVASPGTEGATP